MYICVGQPGDPINIDTHLNLPNYNPSSSTPEQTRNINLTDSCAPIKSLSSTLPSQRNNGQLNRLHRDPKRPCPLLLRTRHQRPHPAPPSPNTRHRRPVPVPRRRHARRRSRDFEDFETVSHWKFDAKRKERKRIEKTPFHLPCHPSNQPTSSEKTVSTP
jgi:hypothetical protein